MKRSLLFIFILSQLTVIAFSQNSTTVSYVQQIANYNQVITNGNNNPSANNGSNQVILSTQGSDARVVLFRPFTRDGSNGSDSTSKRALQVGDQFTIYGSFTRAKGTIGIALLSSPYEISYDDREYNYALSVNLDGPTRDSSGTWGDWYIRASGGSTISTGFGGSQTNGNYDGKYHNYKFQFTLNAPDRMRVVITDSTSGASYTANDILLNKATPITDYSIYLEDDNDGTNNQPVYWGSNLYTGTLVSKGTLYLGGSGNSFSEDSVLSDGLYASQTNVPYQNSLIIPGSATGTITLTATNTYTGLTTVNGGTLQLSNNSGNTLLPTNNATINAGGALEISSNQTLNNLTLANGSNLTIGAGDTLTINGALTDNGATITNNGNIIITPGASFINRSAVPNVTLQQNIIAQRGWRVFANPFSTSINLDTLANKNNITISTTPYASSGLTDVRLYNDTSNQWINVTSDTIPANTPYALFIRGLANEVNGLTYTGGGPSAFVFSVTDTLNVSPVTMPAPIASGNFSLVGNPFAAPILSSALTNGTGVSYYVYTISRTGDGRTKEGRWTPVMMTDTIIPVLGSIIYQPSSSNSYSISSSSIDTTSSRRITGLFGGEVKNSNPLSYLELQVASQGYYQDKLFIRLDNTATVKSNDKIDLGKFANDNVNLYTIAPDNTHLAIDARNTFSTVPLGLKASNGSYTFKVANSSLPDSITVYLADKLLNTQTELVTGSTYNFSVTSDSTSSGEKRFELQFSTKSKSTTTDSGTSDGKLNASIFGNVTKNNQVTVQISGNQNPVTIRVIDMNGRVINIAQATSGTNYINIGQAASGMLLLQISDGKNTIVKKVIKM